MARRIDDDLIINGTLEAGNWWWGIARISVRGGDQSTTQIRGRDFQGTGEMVPQVTARSAYPWTRVEEISVDSPGDNSFDIVIFRTNDTDTDAVWMVWKDGPSERQQEEDGTGGVA